MSDKKEPDSGLFEALRVEKKSDLPDPDDYIIDVAIHDMNHGYQNLGHDSIVYLVNKFTSLLSPLLKPAGLSVRTISFEIRQCRQIPDGSDDRFLLHLGTGGPGHIDPKFNDGLSRGAQDLKENPSWEKPLFKLYDQILANEDAAFLSVCHAYGVACKWSGIAKPEVRSKEKGKSAGARLCILSPEAFEHPWFCRFSFELADGKRFMVLDSRLIDMIPTGKAKFPGVMPIAYETLPNSQKRGDAVTMVEFARQSKCDIPRIFGANNHPEILDRDSQMEVVEAKLARGEVDTQWYEERKTVLDLLDDSKSTGRKIHASSRWTFHEMVRFHLARIITIRRHKLGLPTNPVEEVLVPINILDEV